MSIATAYTPGTILTTEYLYRIYTSLGKKLEEEYCWRLQEGAKPAEDDDPMAAMKREMERDLKK